MYLCWSILPFCVEQRHIFIFCVAKITKINMSARSIPTYPAYLATFEVDFFGALVAPKHDMMWYEILGVQTECRQTKCRQTKCLQTKCRTDKMSNRQNVEQTKCRQTECRTDKMSTIFFFFNFFFLKIFLCRKTMWQAILECRWARTCWN